MIVTTTCWSLVLASGVCSGLVSTCLGITVGFSALNLTQGILSLSALRVAPYPRSGRGLPVYMTDRLFLYT